MTYSLWDFGSGNIIQSFNDEHSAYQAVLEEVELNDDADNLGLEAQDEQGNVTVIASGRLLLEQARQDAGWATPA